MTAFVQTIPPATWPMFCIYPEPHCDHVPSELQTTVPSTQVVPGFVLLGEPGFGVGTAGGVDALVVVGTIGAGFPLPGLG